MNKKRIISHRNQTEVVRVNKFSGKQEEAKNLHQANIVFHFEARFMLLLDSIGKFTCTNNCIQNEINRTHSQCN